MSSHALVATLLTSSAATSAAPMSVMRYFSSYCSLIKASSSSSSFLSRRRHLDQCAAAVATASIHCLSTTCREDNSNKLNAHPLPRMRYFSSSSSSSSSSSYRTESDAFGPIEVSSDALWGAQTQRSIQNFPIGGLESR